MTFSKHFYEALGFMGRNFRFRDDEKFLPLEYFINRYISEQSLDLEHYFLHNTLLKLTNTNNSLIIIDTKGEMSRKKSFLTKMKPIELTKSMKEKNKANLGLSNKVGMLLRRDGEYGSIIASKEHIYVNGMNIRALLDDFGSVILTKVIGENLRIDDLCNSIETSHRSKMVLRIIERGVTRTKDYNVGVMFKASELLMCLVYIYNVIENKGILKKIGENSYERPSVTSFCMLLCEIEKMHHS